MGIESKRQINGTYGSVWLDGELYADVDSFEAKVAGSYEEINMAGDPATHQKFMGWSGEGTIALKKIYSTGINLLSEKFKNGETATFKIVGKLADPDAFGAERVVIDEVTFDEFTLMKFEQKTNGTEELPFKFAKYDVIDKIDR